MADLTKAQPPAWAMSEGYALSSIALTTEIEQEQYQMAVANAQAQGQACQFQANQAVALANQESNTQTESAWGSIASGIVQGGSVIVSYGASWGMNRSEINTGEKDLKNVSKWDETIKNLSSGKKEGADLIASYNAKKTGVAIDSNQIRLANGSEPFDDSLTPAQLATLKAQSEPDFDTLAKNVAANKKSMEEKLSRAYGDRSTLESRLNQLLGQGGSSLAQGIGGLRAAQSKTDEGQYQALQQIANFTSTVTNAISGLITSAVNQAQGLISSMCDNLINGAASANKV